MIFSFLAVEFLSLPRIAGLLVAGILLGLIGSAAALTRFPDGDAR